MRNIVLIGMAGAGKSTIGVLLAKALGMSFIDTDLIIQEREGRLLQEIIDEMGIDGFLGVEEREVMQLNTKGSVIATGGSVVYSSDAMARLKEDGTIIYLKVPYEEIDKRLKDITSRGVVIRKGQSLLDVYTERAPLYERYADVIVDCWDKSIEKIVQYIKDMCLAHQHT